MDFESLFPANDSADYKRRDILKGARSEEKVNEKFPPNQAIRSSAMWFLQVLSEHQSFDFLKRVFFLKLCLNALIANNRREHWLLH